MNEKEKHRIKINISVQISTRSAQAASHQVLDSDHLDKKLDVLPFLLYRYYFIGNKFISDRNYFQVRLKNNSKTKKATVSH